MVSSGTAENHKPELHRRGGEVRRDGEGDHDTDCQKGLSHKYA
jgi:hypothetical protein